MENTLYLECYSGISGDMTVAALLDLGADEGVLREALMSLPLHGYQVKISRVQKSGIDACDFSVLLDETHENHDHDMAYLHGQKEETPHGHIHDHETAHSHEHSHVHDHETAHSHEHRGMREINAIIDAGNMTDHAKNIAKRIFSILAEAEAKAHRVPVEKVHFHEVGAVDSIVDIVAVAVCLDDLNIKEIIIPELWEGRGTVRCQHGILPIPVPAVANIVQMCGIRLNLTSVKGELVTPTGAAIAGALRTSDRLPEQFSILRVGIGAGKRSYETAGILRAMLIQEEKVTGDHIYKLETNIDDCSGEVLGYVMQELFAEGARDVHYIPCFMKKNRPGWILSVICDEEKIDSMEQILFRETTTIGIRRVRMERHILKREQRCVETPLGAADVKVCMTDEKRYLYPEYESTAALARRHQISYREAYEIVQQAAEHCL